MSHAPNPPAAPAARPGRRYPVLNFLRRRLRRYRERHRDPINLGLHILGIPLAVTGVVLLLKLMLEAHETGRAVVWIGALEVAELKADQIHSCGADPFVKKGGHPLGVSVEPAA